MRRNFKQNSTLLLFAVFIFCLAMSTVSVVSAQSSKAKPKAVPTPKPRENALKTPAATASGLAPLETDVLNEIRSLRANPASYVKYLENMKANFNGNFEKLEGGDQMITSEGAAGVDDAIAALKAAKAVPAFNLSPGLNKAAIDHVNDMVKNNIEGHKGSDGTWPPSRVDRYGVWSGQVKENISYHAKSARDIVLNMLIDDGNPKRDHRKNLLSSTLRFIGINSGVTKNFGPVCVLVFVEGFTEHTSGKSRKL